MNQSFTNNNIIKFLYKEIDAIESIEMQVALQEDFLLREEFDTLQKSKRFIPQVKFKPSKATIENILKYSQNSNIKAHA